MTDDRTFLPLVKNALHGADEKPLTKLVTIVTKPMGARAFSLLFLPITCSAMENSFTGLPIYLKPSAYANENNFRTPDPAAPVSLAVESS